MTRKTQPTPCQPPPEPPEGLSERARALWRAVVTASMTPGRLALIEESLRSLTRADEARRLLDEQGLTITTATTGAVHLNPLARVEREARAAFTSSFLKLGLEWERSTFNAL